MEKTAAKTVDEYLARVPEPARASLNKVRAAIRSAAPKGTTESISYRIPIFKHHGPMFKNGAMLIGFAAFANHCSLFPGRISDLDLEDELPGFETSEGTIQFPLDKPPSAALIKKLVRARIEANERRALRRSATKAKKTAAKSPSKKRLKK
jgi:uncharacterized protein YdhG (YjbR/CyaY superfamily)